MSKGISVLKIIGKVLGVLVLVLAGGLLCIYLIYNEKLPHGEQSTKADDLANKMLNAISHDAYKNTRYLAWTFAGQHHYKWDKQLQLVDVSWTEHRVHLNVQDPKASTVLVNSIKVDDASKSKFVEKAVAYFNNDSFWLVAPHKAFDLGTERRIVPQENGELALLVSYTSGGNTPGDSYLWLLDESGLPKSFKMWVSIIPIGGLEATWDGWKTTESGALLPTLHKLLFLELNMEDVKGWN